MVALREWTRAHGPLVLLFDDFCRADLLSWSLLARCAADASAAVVVAVAIRPNDGILAAVTSDRVGRPGNPTRLTPSPIWGTWRVRSSALTSSSAPAWAGHLWQS